MERQIIVSVIECVYLLTMFHLFKTKYSIHHPLEPHITSVSDYMRHPISTHKYENKICQLGKDTSVLLSIWFVLRHFIKIPYKIYINSIIIFSFTIGCLLLNLNAFLYFIPITLYELGYVSYTLL
jgi:hypothetical protein